jgi:hypothetical protein
MVPGLHTERQLAPGGSAADTAAGGQLSLEDVRALLGDEAQSSSDVQLRRMREHAIRHARILIDVVARRRLEESASDALDSESAARTPSTARDSPSAFA